MSSPLGPKALSVNWQWRGSMDQPANSARRNSSTDANASTVVSAPPDMAWT